MNVKLQIDDRIHLDEIEAADRAACVRHLDDPEIYRRTSRIPYPYTAADFDTWLEHIAAIRRQYGEPVHFALRLHRGELIGAAGFEGLEPGHCAEIGYWLAQPYWGQGIMTGVVGGLCQHARQRWQLVRISASVFSFNRASARVLEKNGFRCEGLLHKAVRKDDGFLDALLYARVW